MLIKQKTTIFTTILSILLFLLGSIMQSFITGNNIGLFSTFSASAEESGGYIYIIENNEITIVGYTNPTGNLTIPQTIDGFKVTRIGNRAFANCVQITSVNLPESATCIGDWAFSDCCNLSNITIPDGVTSIGVGAFFSCINLTNVSIPASVTSIGNSAFDNCFSLANITIPDGVTCIGDYAFSSCHSLTNVLIPRSVTSIGNSAFDNCHSLANITIPDGVTSIGDHVFFDCHSLTNVSIPSSVVKIGCLAFKSCENLAKIDVAVSNTEYSSADGVLFNKDKTFLKQYPAGKKDTVYTIPDSVTSIGDSAFEGCTSLKNLAIPDSVTSIGNSTFDRCAGLTSITIPDSVTSIGDRAFSGCSNLTNVSIPGNVARIGGGPFSSCNNLTQIVVDSSNARYSAKNGVLFNIDMTVLIQYPAGKIDAAYTIPDSITNIGADAFSGCSSVTNITIPSSVTSICYGAFASCNGLTSIVIPDGVTCIGDYAFSSCHNLSNVNISNSISDIGEGAFIDCIAIKEVIIPESITSIQKFTFLGCENLKVIALPANISVIEDRAFAGVNFSDVYYAGTEEEWDKIVIIDSWNKGLLAAEIHFSSSGPAPRFTILNDTDVELTYEQGCFGDNDGAVSAKIIRLQEEQETSGAIRLRANGEKLVQADLYSIKIYDKNQNEVQPQNDMKVTVKLPIPESFLNFEDFTVVHWYGKDGSYEKFRVSKNEVKIENGYLIFETGRFSEFAICIDNIFASESQTLAYRVTKQITNYPSAGNIKYSSSDESVAIVDGNGNIKAVGVGSAKITASIDGTDHKESTDIKIAYAWWQWLIRIILLGFIWY